MERPYFQYGEFILKLWDYFICREAVRPFEAGGAFCFNSISPIIIMSENNFITHGVPLHGVKIVPLVKHDDERGFFMEVFQEYWDGPIDPVQWSVVSSKKNVLRGPHIHLDHDEYIAALSGRVHVGLRDVRPNSPTRNCSCMVELSGENPAALMFPVGMVHGWYFSEDTVHLQSVSESYRDYHPHDNHGCHWTDPALDLPWPCTDPILADRAAKFPPLSELVESIYPVLV